MTTIKLKNGSGAPLAGDLVQGEPALDLTNKRLYTENSSGTVIEVGTNPTSLTTGGLTLNAEGDQISIPTSAGFSGVITTGDTVFGNAFEFKNGNAVVLISDTNDSGATGGVDATLIARGSSATKTALFDANGDISFYEDTGTTAKLFWDASAESLGIGTSSPSAALDVSYGDYQNSGAIKIGADLGQNTSRTDASRKFGAITAAHFDNDEADLGLITMDSSSASVSALTIGGGSSSFSSASTINFQTSSDGSSAGTNAMTIDASRNVGIGTSSPAMELDVRNDGASGVAEIGVRGGTNGAGVVQISGNGTTYGSTSFDLIQNSAGAFAFNRANLPLIFGTNNTERVRLDASGNVLVGVTSAQDFTSTTTSGHTLYGGTANVALHSRSGANALAVQRTTNDGALVNFFKDTTAVGSIGTGYGVIDIKGGSAGLLMGNTAVLPVNGSGTLTDGAYDIGTGSFRFKDLYLSGRVAAGAGSVGTPTFHCENDTNTGINLPESDRIQFITGGTERMRIDASGRVGIGVTPNANATLHTHKSDTNRLLLTSATNAIQIIGNPSNVGMFIDNESSTYSDIVFRNTASYSERMRIDGSGNFLVGTQIIPTGGASTGFSISENGGKQMVTHGVSGTANTYVNIYKNANGTVGGIRVSGSATAFDTSSDQRLKENIVNAPSASDDIDAIQVRSFNWKADGEYQKYGMVAQELATVAPIAVNQPEDPEEMMGVDYSKLVPMMLKEIQSLRARVAQLEGEN